jgi:hypothetical protein
MQKCKFASPVRNVLKNKLEIFLRRKKYRNISLVYSPSKPVPGGLLPCFGMVPVEYGALGL